MTTHQGRNDTMPREVQKLDTNIFLLNIRKGKRVTLPDAMMEHMNINDGDILLLKLVEDGMGHVKKFDKVVLEF